MDRANALANLAEDLASAQMLMDDGAGGEAVQAYLDASIKLFRVRQPQALEITKGVELGRIVCRVSFEDKVEMLTARRIDERLP